MNITFSNFDDINNPYYGGGGAISVHEVAKRFARKHRVSIITGTFPGAKNHVRDGVFYRRVGIHTFGPHLAQLSFQLLLPFLIRKEDFDVWVESFTPPFSSAFLPLFTRKPVVGLTHFLGAKHMSKKYKLPFSFIENLALPLYSNFIAITEQLKNQIRVKNKHAEIAVIHNGMLVDSYNAQKWIKKTHILFLGRLDVYQKGIDMLLESYAKYREKIQFPLLIAGYGAPHDVSSVQAKIHELGLQENVTFIGKVTGERKKWLLLTSLMVVAPSRFESFGLTILEAFHYKSPVVTFAIPDLKWIDEAYCKKISPFNLDDFGKAMAFLAHNKKARERYTKKAAAFAEQFSWDEATKKYEQFLADIYAKSVTKTAYAKSQTKTTLKRAITK